MNFQQRETERADRAEAERDAWKGQERSQYELSQAYASQVASLTAIRERAEQLHKALYWMIDWAERGDGNTPEQIARFKRDLDHARSILGAAPSPEPPPAERLASALAEFIDPERAAVPAPKEER